MKTVIALSEAQKIMFKSFTNNSSIRVLIFAAIKLSIKGQIQEKKNDLKNALSCYTEAIEVKCKDDELNSSFYILRWRIHYLLGEFRRHVCFPF